MSVIGPKRYVGALLRLYEAHFGVEPSNVHVNNAWDEQNSTIPPIAVCVFTKASTGLPFDVLITAGMSSTAMSFKESFEDVRWTTELIQYVDGVTDEDIRWMLWLADLPFFDSFVLGYGHTVNFASPLYDGSALSSFLFLNTLIKRDQKLFDGFSASPHPVDLLWVVPVTAAEYSTKTGKGLSVILELFEKHEHPVVLNRMRGCYVCA